MGWLSKIFKGFNRKTSKGHNHANYNEDTDYYLPSTSGDMLSENENEDIDRAIALSLVEENEKGNNENDCNSQLEQDEQLARAIEEGLNLEPPPIYGNGDMYPPIPAYFPLGSRICAGCNTEIGYGRYLNCLNAFWHPECFRCHACNLPISDYECSTCGSYPYHKSCYNKNYHPKCDVCKHFIPINPAGLAEYRTHPFWMQKFCPSHIHDGTPLCCSCERMEPREPGYIDLNDGRKLCLECLDSAIMDTNECQPLYIDIQKFYEGLNMKLDQQIPLLLVEKQELNEEREGEMNGHNHVPETRGVCLSEEQTINTISRRPGFGSGNRASGMRTEPYKLTRHCNVTAILILFGLPRLLTGTILAHEMMHAWLRLEGYQKLSKEVEEGICQVMAHMWLEAELSSASDSNFVSASSSSSSNASRKGRRPHFERKLGEFFKLQIELNSSPLYGDGFRAGHQAVRKYGLQWTLHHIRLTGSFPF